MYFVRLFIFLGMAGVFALLTNCEPHRGTEKLYEAQITYFESNAPESLLRSVGQPFRPWRLLDNVRDYAR